MIYVDRIPLTASAADPQASAKYNKILQRTTGPINILEVRDHILTVDKIEIENTISIDIGAPADPPHRQRMYEDRESRRHTTFQADRQYLFVTLTIAGNRQKLDGLQYEICWNGYELNDDTFQPPPNIPRHFISR